MIEFEPNDDATHVNARFFRGCACGAGITILMWTAIALFLRWMLA